MNLFQPGLGGSIRTGAMTVAGVIPCVLLLSVPHRALERYVSPDALMMLTSCWLIVAVMIILAKGLPGVLANATTFGAAWLIVGLVHLSAAIGLLVDCSQPREPARLSFQTVRAPYQRPKTAVAGGGVYPTRRMKPTDDHDQR